MENTMLSDGPYHLPYRIVFEGKTGAFEVATVATKKEVIEYAERVHGANVVGFTSTPSRLRLELINQPRFDKLVGPMWDRDAVRYESPAVNEVMSR